MRWTDILWTDGPDGNIEHIAANDVSTDEVEYVLDNPIEIGTSRSTGRLIVWGYTAAGRRLAVICDEVDELTDVPVTAFEVEVS